MAPHGCSEVKTNLKSHTGAKRAYYNENELLLQVAKGVSNPVNFLLSMLKLSILTGRFSSYLFLMQKRSLRVSLTDCKTRLVLSHKTFQSLKMRGFYNSTESKGLRTICKKAPLASGKEIQASHADSLSFQRQANNLPAIPE